MSDLPFVDIRDIWNDIVEDFDEIKKFGPLSRWTKEEVYYQCRAGLASIAYENGNWIILKEEVEPLSKRRILWVWLAFGYGIIAMQPRLDVFAKEHGYDEIRMTSPRKGWKRSEDWEELEVTYRREVPFDGCA